MDIITAKEIYLQTAKNLDKIILDTETPAKIVAQCRRFKKALAAYVSAFDSQLSITDEIERTENTSENSNN